jgi:hypothetical protein
LLGNYKEETIELLTVAPYKFIQKVKPMKVISFSLYGKAPKYIEGLLKNLEIQKEKEIYKDWRVAVFHDDSVDKAVLKELNNRKVILQNMSDSGILAASWRFCAADIDCDRFIVRDADSRISAREEQAVEQWMEDDTILHVMRDHPHHGYPINGGMWGMKTGSSLRVKKWLKISMREMIINYQGKVSANINQRKNWWMKDMDFLRDVVYKEFATPFDSTIHNAMDFMDRVPWGCENWAKDFPSPIGIQKKFVGEIFVFDKNGNEKRAHQYKHR